MRVRDLGFDSSVALYWQRNAAGGFDLAGNLADEFRAPCDERDLVARAESRRESCAQAGPYSDDCCYAFFVFRCHRITPFIIFTELPRSRAPQPSLPRPHSRSSNPRATTAPQRCDDAAWP